MSNNYGTLYIVATPIGNLADMTLRGLNVLHKVDAIICEDTRHTDRLLKHYEIQNKTLSFHAHTPAKKVKHIEMMLQEGQNLALVTDAGTPLVSDPGYALLKELYKKDQYTIVAVPGPSALSAAVSLIPLPGGTFTFLGFLPHKKGRKTQLEAIAEGKDNYVFYESTHRIMKLLESLIELAPEKEIWLARELTKQFEEVLHGVAEELHTILTETPEKQKGEFVVAVVG